MTEMWSTAASALAGSTFLTVECTSWYRKVRRIRATRSSYSRSAEDNRDNSPAICQELQTPATSWRCCCNELEQQMTEFDVAARREVVGEGNRLGERSETRPRTTGRTGKKTAARTQEWKQRHGRPSV
jgi:hypothetical protein